MSETRDLKVFISWSGDLAKEVAGELRELLPVIFDGVRPWMSQHDIEAGARGLDEITRELDGTSFGIIVVTNHNQNSQWLNFEAGALSKKVEDGSSVRVVPLLVDLTSGAELTGPMIQFQWKLLNRDGITELLTAIGASIGVGSDVVERRLSAEWDRFEAAVRKAISKTRHPSVVPRRSVESMVEETLELVRNLANDGPRGRSPQDGLAHTLIKKSLARWGEFSVKIRTSNDRVRVDILDPKNILDPNDSAVHAAVRDAIAGGYLDAAPLAVTVNGTPAIPF